MSFFTASIYRTQEEGEPDMYPLLTLTSDKPEFAIDRADIVGAMACAWSDPSLHTSDGARDDSGKYLRVGFYFRVVVLGIDGENRIIFRAKSGDVRYVISDENELKVLKLADPGPPAAPASK